MAKRKYEFNLKIVSKTGGVVIAWRPDLAKWEATRENGKVFIARRRNIENLVAVVNGEDAKQGEA